MSFQIPGLGEAKPNEVLPPIQTEEKPSVPAEDTEMSTDAPAQEQPKLEREQLADAPQAAPQTVSHDDGMNVDAPAAGLPKEAETDTAMGEQPAEQPPPTTNLFASLEAALAPPASTGPTQILPGENLVIQPTGPEDPVPEGQHPEWEEDSSPYESSSESSSDSSDSDDDDDEPYEVLGVEETARLLMEAEGGSDDEGGNKGGSSSAAQLRTKNEQAEEPVTKPDIVITEDMKIEELGSITGIVDTTALIKAITPGEYQVLDTNSVLCTADRTVIGVVSETIGKVLQPLYTLRFSSPAEPTALNLAQGTKVYYPVDHAIYVFTEPLKNLKGSDASNIHDEEVGDEEMEFSDDEKEMEYKRGLKQKKKDKWRANNPEAAAERDATRGGRGGRGGRERGPHPLRQEVGGGGLNYDDGDDEDGPYKPLTRPPGFGSGPSTTENYEPSGRGRGRGRGGRGRGRGGRGGGGGGGSRDGYSLPPQGPPQQQQQQQQAPQQYYPQQQPPPAGNFGFQWPAPGQTAAAAAPPPPNGGFVPPPPPGWNPHQGGGQAQPPAQFNPAFLAALMTQMQQNQQSGGGWQGQQGPPPGQ